MATVKEGKQSPQQGMSQESISQVAQDEFSKVQAHVLVFSI